MSQNVQVLYEMFGLDQVYRSDPLPTMPPLDALNTGAGPPLTVQGNGRILWQATIQTAWIPPDPLPTLPMWQGKIYTQGTPYTKPRQPIPGNKATPPQNVSQFGAIPVFIVPPNAAGAILPGAGLSNEIAQGGTAVVLVAGPVNGGYLVNPSNAAAQGIVTAENLYVDMVNPPGSTDAAAYGTTVLLTPGQTFTVPAIGAGVVIWANAATSGHKVSLTTW
jgi:hypothetical protein